MWLLRWAIKFKSLSIFLRCATAFCFVSGVVNFVLAELHKEQASTDQQVSDKSDSEGPNMSTDSVD